MASIIPEYNYDIFISYRQKDNKGDGWVSEFVEALKTELESTFKEEISVYFDINPHDGLLDTHDVDESLKEKLKCLIFIPVISRTYCDPKSFAWEHEFKAFVEQASNDQFGLKVKLPNGNVASRVLPIIIYDLDKQDIKLFESVIIGVIRGVEFIYRTAGVNRPLRSKENKPQENLNHTDYRDQVNKVANTIKDVLNSLTLEKPSVEGATEEPTIVDEKIPARKPAKKEQREVPTISLLYRLKNLIAIGPKAWRIIALVLFVGLFGSIWFGLKKTPSSPDIPELRYDIPLASNLGRTGRKALAISPDGEYLVYCMNGELYLKQLNSDALSEPISGTDNAMSPFFSPDGTWIGFATWEEMKIMKIPLTGGNPVAICDLGVDLNQANWQEKEIIYAEGSSIYRVPDSGGAPELLYPLSQSENDQILWNPQLLPDKKTLLFSQQLEEGGWRILTWRLESKESPDVIVERGRDGRYLKSGHIAYSLNNRLYICKFNSRTNRIVSDPQIITTNQLWERITLINYGSAQFDISDNGILVYYEQQQNIIQENIVWLEESGDIIPITTNIENYGFTPISSDAQYIAAAVLTESVPHIEIINTRTGNGDLFAEGAHSPGWSIDDSSVYYTLRSTNNQVFQKPLDRSKPPELLYEIDSANYLESYPLSKDGRYLPFNATFLAGFDIGYYDILNNKVEMLDYYNTPGNEVSPIISPDGKWLAYISDYDGQSAIYIAPFPGPGQRIKVASKSDHPPVWSPDMTALYYCTLNPDYELWRVNILKTSDNNLDFEPAQSIFNGGDKILPSRIEIHPNGDRFLVFQRESTSEDATEPRIKVIVNWEQELDSK